METTRPTYTQVANHFYHDAMDLNQRFTHCWESESPSFHAVKSKRMKLFIDLRMAMESALKAIVTYYCHKDKKGKTLVNRVEKYRHYIDKLIKKGLQHIPQNHQDEVSKLCEELDRLPVGLRYRLDAMDFKYNNEQIYYATIGSDEWLQNSSSIIKNLTDFIGKELGKESRIIGGHDLMKEVLEQKYHKYGERT